MAPPTRCHTHGLPLVVAMLVAIPLAAQQRVSVPVADSARASRPFGSTTAAPFSDTPGGPQSHSALIGPQRCEPDTSRHARDLLAYVKNLVSNPALDRARFSLGITPIDTADVVYIGAETLCRAAAQVMNRQAGAAADRVIPLYLVRFGDKYWAESPAIRGGEYLMAGILDSGLTKVLRTAAR